MFHPQWRETALTALDETFDLVVPQIDGDEPCRPASADCAWLMGWSFQPLVVSMASNAFCAVCGTCPPLVCPSNEAINELAPPMPLLIMPGTWLSHELCPV